MSVDVDTSDTRVETPYGSWSSPVTSDLIAGQAVRLGEPRIAEDGIYWLEGRPAEGGRVVLVRTGADGQPADLTPTPFSIRSRVHEYGGGAWTVDQGMIFFVNDADQVLYWHAPGTQPIPLTPADGRRYADLVLDRDRDRLIAVCEDHREPGEPANSIVAIGIGNGVIETLAAGADFYSSPRIHPAGASLAWLSWNHPRMPWDGTELWTAPFIAGGQLGEPALAAGGAEESIFQPEWAPNGELFFVSDRTGWWNLYRSDGAQVTAVTGELAEFGRPQWLFGMSLYGFIDDRRLLCAVNREGRWELVRIEMPAGRMETLDTSWTDIEHLSVGGGRGVMLTGSPIQLQSIVSIEPENAQTTVLRPAAQLDLGDDLFSTPETLQFETSGGARAYGFYYPPHNPRFRAPAAELPPLLVKCHGGPTSASEDTLDLRIQYWTSRGFAVLDVNYRGSTGYGREYRRSLYGHWGVADTDDCIAGANHLVEQQKADPKRLAISGSSAGGFTVLCALTFHKVFAAGASYYGIGDLASAMTETHKFESRYGDELVGPWPEAEALYRRRSPINAVDRLACPVIFFQGLRDKVVPPNQADRMAAALRSKGLPVAHVVFEDEGHGFRKGANIRVALEAEYAFYARIFDFEPADALPPLTIENLQDK